MFWINFNLIAYHSQTDFLSYFLTQKVSIFYDFHQGLGKDTSNASHIDCFKLVVSSSTPHEKNKKNIFSNIDKAFRGVHKVFINIHSIVLCQ